MTSSEHRPQSVPNEVKKMLVALQLELPEAVWDDVNTKVSRLLEQLEADRFRLLEAEEFIAHMDMNYRYAEWLERATTNPAKDSDA